MRIPVLLLSPHTKRQSESGPHLLSVWKVLQASGPFPFEEFQAVAARARIHSGSQTKYLETIPFTFVSFHLHAHALEMLAKAGCENSQSNMSLMWALSGSDSGIGHRLAKYLDSLGFVVFAGVLNEKGPGAEELKKMCSAKLSVLQLDVTSSGQIKEAVAKVTRKLQNAGIFSVHARSCCEFQSRMHMNFLQKDGLLM